MSRAGQDLPLLLIQMCQALFIPDPCRTGCHLFIQPVIIINHINLKVIWLGDLARFETGREALRSLSRAQLQFYCGFFIPVLCFTPIRGCSEDRDFLKGS